MPKHVFFSDNSSEDVDDVKALPDDYSPTKKSKKKKKKRKMKIKAESADITFTDTEDAMPKIKKEKSIKTMTSETHPPEPDLQYSGVAKPGGGEDVEVPDVTGIADDYCPTKKNKKKKKMKRSAESADVTSTDTEDAMLKIKKQKLMETMTLEIQPPQPDAQYSGVERKEEGEEVKVPDVTGISDDYSPTKKNKKKKKMKRTAESEDITLTDTEDAMLKNKKQILMETMTLEIQPPQPDAQFSGVERKEEGEEVKVPDVTGISDDYSPTKKNKKKKKMKRTAESEDVTLTDTEDAMPKVKKEKSIKTMTSETHPPQPDLQYSGVDKTGEGEDFEVPDVTGIADDYSPTKKNKKKKKMKRTAESEDITFTDTEEAISKIKEEKSIKTMASETHPPQPDLQYSGVDKTGEGEDVEVPDVTGIADDYCPTKKSKKKKKMKRRAESEDITLTDTEDAMPKIKKQILMETMTMEIQPPQPDAQYSSVERTKEGEDVEVLDVTNISVDCSPTKENKTKKKKKMKIKSESEDLPLNTSTTTVKTSPKKEKAFFLANLKLKQKEFTPRSILKESFCKNLFGKSPRKHVSFDVPFKELTVSKTTKTAEQVKINDSDDWAKKKFAEKIQESKDTTEEKSKTPKIKLTATTQEETKKITTGKKLTQTVPKQTVTRVKGHMTKIEMTTPKSESPAARVAETQGPRKDSDMDDGSLQLNTVEAQVDIDASPPGDFEIAGDTEESIAQQKGQERPDTGNGTGEQEEFEGKANDAEEDSNSTKEISKEAQVPVEETSIDQNSGVDIEKGNSNVIETKLWNVRNWERQRSSSSSSEDNLFGSDDTDVDETYVPDEPCSSDDSGGSSKRGVVQFQSSTEEIHTVSAQKTSPPSRGRRGVGRGKTSTRKALSEAEVKTGALKPCPFCGYRRRSHLKKHLLSMHRHEIGGSVEKATQMQKSLTKMFTSQGISRYPESYIRQHFGKIATTMWKQLLIGLNQCSIQVIPTGTSFRQIMDTKMPTYPEAEMSGVSDASDNEDLDGSKPDSLRTSPTDRPTVSKTK